MNPYSYPPEYFLNPNFYPSSYYDYSPEDFMTNEFYGGGYHYLFHGGPAGTLYPYSNFQFKPLPLYERRNFIDLPKNKFARDFYIEDQSNFMATNHKRSAEPHPMIFMSNQGQDIENIEASNQNAINLATTSSSTFSNSIDKESSHTKVHKRNQPQSSDHKRSDQDIENVAAANFNNVEISTTNSNSLVSSKDKESSNTIIQKRNQSQSSDQKRSIVEKQPSVFVSNQNQDIENTEAESFNENGMSATEINTFASAKDKESSKTSFRKRIHPNSIPSFSSNQLQDIQNLEAANFKSAQMSATNANNFASSKDKESSNMIMIS
ncbi:28328_t:CDS:1 [Racocetra persica]|uniref:28328_t:CDS:1 n=1 Tax=Racocetra persica TaxID=160502 RepID=A0ACA9RZ13_9GLOM|nr:28328_t:CDS:1 [Racocetra persica]